MYHPVPRLYREVVKARTLPYALGGSESPSPSALSIQVSDSGPWRLEATSTTTELERGSVRSYEDLELRMCVWFSVALASAEHVLRSARHVTGGPWF